MWNSFQCNLAYTKDYITYVYITQRGFYMKHFKDFANNIWIIRGDVKSGDIYVSNYQNESLITNKTIKRKYSYLIYHLVAATFIRAFIK